MASSSRMERTALQEEIYQLSTLFTQANDRIDNLAKLAIQSPPGRVAQLETETLKNQNAQYANVIKWQSERIKDVEQKLEAQRLDLENAVSAREGALRKYQRALRVIRDLVQERENSASSSSRQQANQDILEGLHEDFHDALEDSPPTTDSSDETVRQIYSPPEPIQPFLFDSPVAAPEPMPQSPLATEILDDEQHFGQSVHPEYEIQTESTTDPDRSSSQSHSPEHIWYIQFKKPPGCAGEFCSAPIPWGDLRDSVGLQDDEVESLGSLEIMTDLGLRLQITQSDGMDTEREMAFIYDPLFVDRKETPLTSHLVDWGFQYANYNVEHSILQRGEGESAVFHTFTFPLKEKNWFYIGAQEWTVTEETHESRIWPTLDDRSRQKIIRKLDIRSKGAFGEEELARMLDNGELAEMWLKLSRVSDLGISQRFLRKIEYRDQQIQARVKGSASSQSSSRH